MKNPLADPVRQTSILVVDDDTAMVEIVRRVADGAGYRCLTATSADGAREVLSADRADLLVCDVRMPGVDGLELISELHHQDPDMGIMMLSGVDDPLVAEVAAERGASGYLLKPFNDRQLVIEIANALHRRRAQWQQASREANLEASLAERNLDLEATNAELRAARSEIIHRLSRAVEARDGDTGEHIERIGHLAGRLAGWLGKDDAMQEAIQLAAPMHDVGKIGVSDAILLKPGPLTDKERSAMERHTEIGHQILSGSGLDVLDLAASIALSHHERWDGDGYPNGLAGEAIPFEGRVVAVADVFDALLSERVYRPAFDLDSALDIMRAGRANQFDPKIFDAFIDNLDTVIEISGVERGGGSKPGSKAATETTRPVLPRERTIGSAKRLGAIASQVGR